MGTVFRALEKSKIRIYSISGQKKQKQILDSGNTKSTKFIAALKPGNTRPKSAIKTDKKTESAQKPQSDFPEEYQVKL